MLKSAEHKFVLLINLVKLQTIAYYFLLYIAEHENFSANKYENANYCCIEIFMLSWTEHEKSFITLGPGMDLRRMDIYLGEVALSNHFCFALLLKKVLL